MSIFLTASTPHRAILIKSLRDVQMAALSNQYALAKATSLRGAHHGIMLAHDSWNYRLEDNIHHDDGKIHAITNMMSAEIDRLLASDADDRRGLKMFGMRKLRSMNSWMHNVERLVRNDGPALLVHPEKRSENGPQHVRSRNG